MSDNNDSDRQLSRRRFMLMSSLLALGLAYQKPVIETLHTRATLGHYAAPEGDDKRGENDGK